MIERKYKKRIIDDFPGCYYAVLNCIERDAPSYYYVHDGRNQFELIQDITADSVQATPTQFSINPPANGMCNLPLPL